MTFEFEGKNYEVSNQAQGTNKLIKLSDGRVVRVIKWKICYPPQPKEIEEVLILKANEIK